MKNKQLLRYAALSLFLIGFAAMATTAQTTEFAYQGSLKDGGNPANGNYDLQFELYGVASGGAPIGTRTRLNVPVTNGVFTVLLDFLPAAFDGTDRFLEIGVKAAGSPAGYQQLLPRQRITHVPYSFRSLNAATAEAATNSLQLGGLAADQFVTTAIGNSSYVRNTTSPQASSNFNISGNGKADIFNAATQYEIGGNRVLGVPGTNNVFAGVNAGSANTTGEDNSFFGRGAGFVNTEGSRNSFFGRAAGQSNVTGIDNSFFGSNAGQNSTTNNNSFFGSSAGFNTTSGANNTFLGRQAGVLNTIGSNNTAIGERSGVSLNNLSYATAIGSDAIVSASNTIQLGRAAGTDSVLIPGNVTASGALNLTGSGTFGNLTVTGNLTANLPAGDGSYIQDRTGLLGQQTASFNISGDGYVSGTFHATGAINTVTQYNLAGNRVLGIGSSSSLFVGLGAGANNTGQGNTLVGRNAGNASTSGSGNSFFGSSAGLSNTAGGSNSFFGDGAGLSNVTGARNAFFGVSAGASNTTSYNSFFGSQAGRDTTTGSNNAFFGESAGINNETACCNAFFGAFTGDENLTGEHNVFVGSSAGSFNTSGGSNTFVGSGAGFINVGGDNNTFIGSGATPASGNPNLNYATAIGADATASSSNTLVLGRSNGSDTVVVPGKLQIDTLATAGSTNLCLNGSNRIAPCSSSLRYKTNITPFGAGLALLNRLRPISFTWKDGGMADLGLGAEDVEKIEPLLVTYNKAGQVEGVKYDRIGIVLVNAVQEQQKQIKAQQKQIDEQNVEMAALKRLVCGRNRRAKACFR